MPKARAFAYNTGEPLEGTEQVGDLAVSIPGEPAPSPSFSEGYGGLRWWNGPDEYRGLVIARPNPEGNQPNPDGGPAFVCFYGKLNEDGFRAYAGLLSNGAEEFATAEEASIWLTENGYWNSYGLIIPDFETGFNFGVLTSTIDSNGKIYIGGFFTTYKGVTENRIISLNPDGSKNTGFNNSTGFGSTVNTITIDSNGKIYVGGAFTTYKGVTENRIVRLNPDGSKDTGFDNSTGFNGEVRAIVTDSNGKIYVGGSFFTYKGVTANRIIRLNPDGSKDTGFDNTTGFNGEVRAIVTDSNGKIYVGGDFSTYKGVTENRIVRLNPDGSKDTGFDNSTGFVGSVYEITIDSNGKIYVGGDFSTYKGVTENRIVRLNPDGSKDTGFDNTTGFNNTVFSITIDSIGKIYVSGNFTSYKSVTATRIIRLNPDGSKDTGT